MFAKFEGLEDEKRERILKAAMKEFSDKGYEKASTNEIVREAGIAKGLLFHYFKSKKQLFFYLYDYCVDQVTRNIYASAAMEERDFFQRLRVGQQTKMALLLRYPEMFKFMQAAYMEESHAIRPDMEKKNRDFISQASGKFFHDIDTTKFREGLDVQAAINIVLWSMEGFTNQYLLRMKKAGEAFDFEKALGEVDKYFELFRDSFYK